MKTKATEIGFVSIFGILRANKFVEVLYVAIMIGVVV